MSFSVENKSARIALRIGVACFAACLLQGLPACNAAETVFYSFQGGNDGGGPEAGLVNVRGTFYGSTIQGGTGTNCTGGCGTVFSLNPTTSTETVVYSFKGDNDGAIPEASLTEVNGLLYGTTRQGGTGSNCSGGCGTVFSLDPTTGTETVLYSFQGGSDGGNPEAGVINVRGILYGTTYSGGTGANCSNGCGTVFSLDPTTETETVVYSFQGGSDGANPQANLTSRGKNLYGTTTQGGTGTLCSNGCGTVFKIKNGAETSLYSFLGGNDGAFPTSDLIALNGLLYGTTPNGGTGTCSYNGLAGCGTVYAISPSGSESVLYSFAGISGGDGANPDASLVNVKGVLYGTTSMGGDSQCGVTGGCGTVFSISTTGAEMVQWTFQGGRFDGAAPHAPLLKKNSVLYGTASLGAGSGCAGKGCGALIGIRLPR